MRAFATLLTVFSVALSASAAPAVAANADTANGVISGRTVNVKAVTDAVTNVVSKVGASNVLNSNVEQTQSHHHRRDRDHNAVDANVVTEIVTNIMNGIKVDNVLNHDVKQTQRRNILDVDAVTGALTTVVSVVKASNIGNSNVHQSQRREEKDLVAIVLDVTAKVAVIYKKLLIVIGGRVGVDVSIILPFLVQVKEVLIEAAGEVKIIVAHPERIVLLLDGKVLSVLEFAKLVAVVIHLVCGVITIAIKAVGDAQVYLIARVASDICVYLGLILHLIFGVVVELLVHLRPLIGDVVFTITNVDVFAALAVVLKLKL